MFFADDSNFNDEILNNRGLGGYVVFKTDMRFFRGKHGGVSKFGAMQKRSFPRARRAKATEATADNGPVSMDCDVNDNEPIAMDCNATDDEQRLLVGATAQPSRPSPARFRPEASEAAEEEDDEDQEESEDTEDDVTDSADSDFEADSQMETE